MQKNEVREGVVVAFGSDGEGVIKADEFTAFVPYCLPEERVSFKALKVKGNVVFGKIENVISQSACRVAPECDNFTRCGGCQLQHLSYERQLLFKSEQVESCLKKLGGIEAEVLPTVPSEKQYAYRNKLALPIGVDENGNTVVGMYASRSHRIIPLNDCSIQADWCKYIIQSVLKFARTSGYKGYNEITKKGELRHVVVREIDGKYIITLVAKKRIKAQNFSDILREYFDDFTLVLNVNAGDGNAILGKDFYAVKGDGFYTAEADGVKFKAGANTFLQVNDGVRNKLYSAVIDSITHDEKELKNTVALDLYSGGGMLTAMLAKKCKTAYGIEIVPEATECANELAKLNGLENRMINVCGKVEDKLADVMQKTDGDKRVIVCDPPRKGMERSVVKAILESNAERVVMVSCNPATLARDLGLLCGSLVECDGQLVKNTNGIEKFNAYYDIDFIIPFDMFPQTKHVESVVCLTRK